MEPILCNRCEYSEEHLTEALRAQTQELQKKKNLILAIAIGLLLAFSVYTWLSTGEQKYVLYALICAGMYGLLLYTNYSLPRRTAKLQAARIREKNGGLEFRILFRPEEIAMVSPGGTEDAQVPYAEFSRIRQTPGLILLFTDEKKMILLDPERFEKGTEADFWRLMNEKCPRAVPKAKRTL